MCVVVHSVVVFNEWILSARPGWTLTDPDVEESLGPPPKGAWSARESVEFMLDAVRQGVFYIMVPDGQIRKEVDQLRIMWAAADITEGRPALSRWHPNYKVSGLSVWGLLPI